MTLGFNDSRFCGDFSCVFSLDFDHTAMLTHSANFGGSHLVMDIEQFPAADEIPRWTVARAKARLSEVIERAQSLAQIITRNGKPSVVVSAEEWRRKTERKGTLAQFLLDSPLRGADLDLERMRDQPRDLPL